MRPNPMGFFSILPFYFRAVNGIWYTEIIVINRKESYEIIHFRPL